MGTGKDKLVSIVVPCRNEMENLPCLLAALRSVASERAEYGFEFLFVDDGSEDETESFLIREGRADARVRGICLSRNFGHQRAITAGLDVCSGDYVVVMDADMQDPPALIPELLRRLEEGSDLVHAVRTDRRSDNCVKRLTARWFYRIMRRWVLPELPEDAGDFKAFNGEVLGVFRQYRERVRFLRGIFATLGFRSTVVPYVRSKRRAGRSKYLPKQVLRLARDAFVSYTALPLRLGIYAGGVVLALFPFYVMGAVRLALRGVSQTDALMLVLLAMMWGFSGLILVLLGSIGEYLKCIILEVKQRPLYTIRAVHNMPGKHAEGSTEIGRQNAP